MEEDLKQWLFKHNILYTLHTHPAVFTVPEARVHCGHIPGTHCKNLFLRNKKSGEYYLVTIPHNERLDLKKFRKLINAPKIRFSEAEDLWDILKLTPGAVSPLGLINDYENKTIFFIDRNVWNAVEICCHPNVNTETLQLSQNNFHNIIKATKNRFKVISLPFLEENNNSQK